MTSLTKEFPADSFIGRYLRWARRLTDAPEIFHVGCALAALSSVFGPRVRLRMPVRTDTDDEAVSLLYLWVGLVGPSRKTTSIRLLWDVLVDGPIEWTDEDRKSAERTFDFLAKHPHGLIVEDNWVDVLRRLRSSGWAMGHGLLAGLQDGDTMRRVTTGGKKWEVVETRIDTPRLSLLTGYSGATEKPIPPAVQMLMRRMIWLWGDFEYRPDHPPKQDPAGAEKLFVRLAHLRRWSFDIADVDSKGKRRTKSRPKGLVRVDRKAMGVLASWSKTLPSTLARLPGLVIRAATLDVLGTLDWWAAGGCEVEVEASDVERMIRVIGPAAIAGAAKALVA